MSLISASVSEGLQQKISLTSIHLGAVNLKGEYGLIKTIQLLSPEKTWGSNEVRAVCMAHACFLDRGLKWPF